MSKTKVAIIGSGNIGMDLMFKVLGSDYLSMGLLAGVNADSERLKKAESMGIPVSDKGIRAIEEDPACCEIVFDATTAKAHILHAPLLRSLGKRVIDLTPAGVGVRVVPTLNLKENLDADNINLISCGGQAVLPVIGAVAEIATIEYAEAVNASGSLSVGPGTRANIDEYTNHTRHAIEDLTGAKKAKSIIIINPADPPILMHNTIFLVLEKLDETIAREAERKILDKVEEVRRYVPGYHMVMAPQFDYDRRLVTTMVEIKGAGDYLPEYSGNLDIITQAAVHIAEIWARDIQGRCEQ